MACVIVEKFPRCAADLRLYESKIHEAHRQFPGDALLEYDKSFRLKMQAHPEMEWNEEDVSSYTHKMMVAKEVAELREEIKSLQDKQKATLGELQRMVGKLNFAIRVIPAGRVFVRRLSNLTLNLRERHQHVRLGAGVKSDLAM
ncbi:hypothetical protein NDU88_002294 [Pleurodeles waltl]|uniref:Uncharacterized protein n=1 Tax=Pleurodeles waltl TaxID=8319 RepID=A0AAV7VA49_PLEWA|nr:hypothetical protein NDU88_002294 [Pleurodeles waltl]